MFLCPVWRFRLQGVADPAPYYIFSKVPMGKRTYNITNTGFILATFLSFTVITLLLWGITYVFFFVITGHLRYLRVPQTKYLTWSQTAELLDEVGLKAVINDSSSYDPKFKKLEILNSYPLAGQEVKKGRRVYFTVNASQYSQVSVPDVVEKTLREAVAMIRTSGFLVDKLEYIDGKGRNVVTDILHNGVSVKSGSFLYKNTPLTLQLRRGVRSTITTVPEVTGMILDQAGDFLHTQSLNFRVFGKKNRSENVKVYRQYPPPGTAYRMGNRIDIWVK